jgi:hypothetical protein
MGVVSRGTGASPSAGVGEVAGGHGFATSGVNLDPLGQTPTHLDLPATDVPADVPLSNGQGNGTTADPRAATLAISQSSDTNVRQPGGLQSGQPIDQPAERTVVGPADRELVRNFFQPTDAPQP